MKSMLLNSYSSRASHYNRLDKLFCINTEVII